MRGYRPGRCCQPQPEDGPLVPRHLTDPMYRKLLTRLLTLCTLALIGYFAVISTDTGMIRPEKSSRVNDLSANEMNLGEGGYKSFNAQGEEVASGTFGKVKMDEASYKAEDINGYLPTESGKRVFVVAGHFVTEPDGRRVLSSKNGEDIVLREENGITIRTRGPLIYTADDMIYTEERAQFSLANARGSCIGLRYHALSLLEMSRDVAFATTDKQGETRIDAAYLKLNEKTNHGTVRDGVITSIQGEERTWLEAENIELNYAGGDKYDPYRIVEISMLGEPALFRWGQGELESGSFEVCFDSSGRWVEQLTTGADALFTTVTEDGYWFTGRAGSLTLDSWAWEPLELSGNAEVSLIGRKDDGPELTLSGKQGMTTTFFNGKATSTRIFGEPVFTFDGQQGRAGSLRLLHGEHQILLSKGGELWNPEQNVRIKGDEILMSNWDLREKEIFALHFVEVVYNEGSPREIRATGEKMTLELPKNHVELGGKPARVVRPNQTVEAQSIHITEVDTNLFDMLSEEGVTINMVTAGGTYWIQARKMFYEGKSRRLLFEQVQRARTPNQGELSCGTMEVLLKKGTDTPTVELIHATRDVVFKGMIEHEKKPEPFSCQADVVDFKAEEQVIHFQGVTNDVIFNGPRGETRNRGLIYNQKDGSLSGYSEGNRMSTTKVPLEKPNPPNER